MEAFLTSAAQHFTSVVNLMLMRRLDTGDRMFDTTIQMLLSTLIGGIVSGLVTLYTKGMWRDFQNRATCFFNSAKYSPIEFDARLAPAKPMNDRAFQYSMHISHTQWPTFVSWFFTYHKDKIFTTQKLTQSFTLPRLTGELKGINPILDREGIQESRCARIRIPKDVYVPIWRNKDGVYVYFTTSDMDIEDRCDIFSDSAGAITECLAHILQHNERMEEYDRERHEAGDGSVMKIREFNIEDGEVNYTNAKINKRKTFDNLFFTQKDEVVRMITGFKQGTLFPAHLPIDNKLGFLLHGPPGTGKTGFIAAVANFLGRHVVNVDTSRIKTRKALDAVLDEDPSKNIFIFEEFDCMPGVTRRGGGAEDGVDGSDGGSEKGAGGAGGTDPAAYAMFLMAQKDKSEDLMGDLRRERKDAADKMDLGYLLRKLDGLESGEGRIIIATTNHPERIDPALLRPGRFGIQLHLTRCTRKMLQEIVTMIYQLPQEESEALVHSFADVPDLKWAPAEVLQLGLTLSGKEEMVRHLREEEPGRMD